MAQAVADGGKRVMDVAAAEQEFRGIDRPSANKNILRPAFPALAAIGVIFESDVVVIAVSANRLDAHHFALCSDFGAIVSRDGQIVEIQRILGMNITSDVAFAAKSTPPL